MLQLSFSSVLTRHHLTHNGCATRARGATVAPCAGPPPLLLLGARCAPFCSLAAPAACRSLVFCLASSVLRCAHTPSRRAAPLRRGSTSIEAAAELGQLLEGLAEVLLGWG